MKKLLLAGAALLSLTTAASAADLAARPYTKAPPLSPAINWSGFYIGAMGGYAFDSDNGGGFGGGTIGYNWQFPGSQFVFGIEIDAAGASIKEARRFHRHLAGHGRRQDRRTWKRDRPRRRRGECGAVLRQGRLCLGQQQAVRHRARRYRLGQPCPFRIHRRRRHRIHVRAELVRQGRIHVHAPRRPDLHRLRVPFDSGTAEFSSVKVGINYHFK